ncbi:prolyl oligopeptidase family serine peptidase [Rhizobium sp. BK313]|uniref:alpha/beta hydrolase family protein n=1 Tax=Rhizobium sp. BK313 TaxID=2587081 RepID=UPI0028AA07F1|nr:prolyl oligopeptidase family serine peptidase [Rhizobium sp. BK313]
MTATRPVRAGASGSASAISKGIAGPSRIAIMGGSCGGYAALAPLTFTPEKFARAIDLVGTFNLVTLINTIVPQTPT